MDSRALVLERKIMGVLIRAAREKAHRTFNQVAARLGVTPARVHAYETGAREITLPELQVLALYLGIPVSFFLNDHQALKGEALPLPAREEEMRTRRAMLGAKLRQARLAAGKGLDECGAVVGRTGRMVARYERGQVDIPVSELERLGKFLQVGWDYFLEGTRATPKDADLFDMELWARLPAEIRAFILDSNSLPYLRMAMKFRDMPSSKLQELGEILLVVR